MRNAYKNLLGKTKEIHTSVGVDGKIILNDIISK